MRTRIALILALTAATALSACAGRRAAPPAGAAGPTRPRRSRSSNSSRDRSRARWRISASMSGSACSSATTVRTSPRKRARSWSVRPLAPPLSERPPPGRRQLRRARHPRIQPRPRGSPRRRGARLPHLARHSRQPHRDGLLRQGAPARSAFDGRSLGGEPQRPLPDRVRRRFLIGSVYKGGLLCRNFDRASA